MQSILYYSMDCIFNICADQHCTTVCRIDEFVFLSLIVIAAITQDLKVFPRTQSWGSVSPSFVFGGSG